MPSQQAEERSLLYSLKSLSRGDGGKLAQILSFIYLYLLSYSFMKYQFLIDIYISLAIYCNNKITVLPGRSEGKRSLWRPRRRWEDDIKKDLKEMVFYAGTGWILLKIGTNGELM